MTKLHGRWRASKSSFDIDLYILEEITLEFTENKFSATNIMDYIDGNYNIGECLGTIRLDPYEWLPRCRLFATDEEYYEAECLNGFIGELFDRNNKFTISADDTLTITTSSNCYITFTRIHNK